jgi:hypothetical protein
VNLSLSAYDPATGKLVLTGKRRKQRAVYLLGGSADAMADWLEGDGPAYCEALGLDDLRMRRWIAGGCKIPRRWVIP